MARRGERWLLLHGTPLTPEVWDGVTPHRSPSGPAWCPDITPPGEARDVQGTLAARLAAEAAEQPGSLHVVGHPFGGPGRAGFPPARPPRRGCVPASRLTPAPRSAAGSPRPISTGTAR